jgi:hypothetical protein
MLRREHSPTTVWTSPDLELQSGTIQGPAVPEPGTYLLAALGVVVTLAGRCRK